MASIENNDLSMEDLGLESVKVEKAPKKAASTKSPASSKNVSNATEAMQKAAASVALKAAMDANSEISIKEANKTYIIEKKKYMLNRCKEDAQVEFVGQKIFANYFGPVYTFLYNGIPVTVKFDGSKQTFPKFIYDRIMAKINEVSDSNTNKVDIEYRSEE